jgi:putative FmdB family regulatory protein
MPTYVFQCQQCGFQFEKFLKITDESIHKCPQCNGETQRLISGGAGFLLKGSGFHQNDYKKHESCCGKSEGCDNPKKCCEK